MHRYKLVLRILPFALLSFVFSQHALADTVTQSGSFAADNSVHTYSFTTTGTQN